MNILLINHYAGSVHHGMEYRPYYLAREWVRLGHRVHIVAASCSHLRQQSPEMAGRVRLDQTIDGIDYTWLRTPGYEGNGLGRVRNMLAFVTRLWREGPRLVRRLAPDAVIASSTYPLDIWPAHRIAALAGAVLVHEVHDLWPLSPIELGGHSHRHPFIMLLQAAEHHACRNADAIVSILPKVRTHLESRGMAPHKLHLVPNGIDPDEWAPVLPPDADLAAPDVRPGSPARGNTASGPAALPDRLRALFARLRADDRTIVGYAGSHGLSNALDTLLDAAHLLRGHPLSFVLVGSGPEKDSLQRRARALGLEHLHFVEPVPRRQIPGLLRQFDIAFLGWRRQPLYRFGIAPNKLLDYMMAGCPVLHAVEAGNDPVAEAGCGISVAPDDPQALAEGLARLLALPVQARRALGALGRRHVLAHHGYPVLARRFLTALATETHHA